MFRLFRRDPVAVSTSEVIRARQWYRPSYWRWWWHTHPRGKGVLALLLPVLLVAAGFFAGTSASESEQAVSTQRVITITRTTVVNGKPPIVREVRTATLPAETRLVTVRRNGRTVLVTAPAETIVTQTTLPGRKTVVTKIKNQTVVQTVPRDRLRTVTLPGKTLPGTTVAGPERVVTLTGPERVVTTPGRTVTNERVVTTPGQTVTAPAQTVVNTVTAPAQTVTQTRTQTLPAVTVTNTVTNTVTSTVTVTEPPGHKPPPPTNP